MVEPQQLATATRSNWLAGGKCENPLVGIHIDDVELLLTQPTAVIGRHDDAIKVAEVHRVEIEHAGLEAGCEEFTEIR